MQWPDTDELAWSIAGVWLSSVGQLEVMGALQGGIFFQCVSQDDPNVYDTKNDLVVAREHALHIVDLRVDPTRLVRLHACVAFYDPSAAWDIIFASEHLRLNHFLWDSVCVAAHSTAKFPPIISEAYAAVHDGGLRRFFSRVCSLCLLKCDPAAVHAQLSTLLAHPVAVRTDGHHDFVKHVCLSSAISLAPADGQLCPAPIQYPGCGLLMSRTDHVVFVLVSVFGKFDRQWDYPESIKAARDWLKAHINSHKKTTLQFIFHKWHEERTAQ